MSVERDLRQRNQPLREHSFARVARGELRRRGKVGEAAEDQLGGGDRILVRQTADAGRDSGDEHGRSEGRRHGPVLYGWP